MKRKPIEIVGTLLNGLNSLNKNGKYSINEIHEKTGFHYNTVKEYMKLINLIQCFSPRIEMNLNSNKISIKEYAPFTTTFNDTQQLELMLFVNRALSEESAKNIKELEITPRIIKESNQFMEIIYDNNDHPVSAYLTTRGKFKAQGLLVFINQKIGEIIDNKEDFPNIHKKILCHYDRKYLYHPYNCINKENINEEDVKFFNSSNLSTKSSASSAIA
jgi:hypothetical protein